MDLNNQNVDREILKKALNQAIPRKFKILIQWYFVILIFPVPWGLAIFFLIERIIPIWADVLLWILPILSTIFLVFIAKDFFTKRFKKLNEQGIDFANLVNNQKRTPNNDIPEVEEVSDNDN